MKTAIIMLSWGEPVLTDRCIKHLFTETKDFELFWVINEFEKSVEYLAPTFDWLHTNTTPEDVMFIMNPTNLGFAGGVNSALATVLRSDEFDYVALINNDVVVYENWLPKMIRAMPDDCGAIGCLVDNGGFQKINHMANRYDRVPPSDIRESVEKYNKRIEDNDHFIPTTELAFFCTVMPFDAVKKIGLLDEGFGLAYGEDNDYCIRLRREGYQVGVATNTAVHHVHGGTSSLSKKEKEDQRAQAVKYLKEKWEETSE